MHLAKNSCMYRILFDGFVFAYIYMHFYCPCSQGSVVLAAVWDLALKVYIGCETKCFQIKR